MNSAGVKCNNYNSGTLGLEKKLVSTTISSGPLILSGLCTHKLSGVGAVLRCEKQFAIRQMQKISRTGILILFRLRV
jgi:hypothetical protein